MSPKSFPLIAVLFVCLPTQSAHASGADDPLDQPPEGIEARQPETSPATPVEDAAAQPTAKKEQPWKGVFQAGGKDVNLKISGQISRMALHYDDGEESDLRSVDNDHSSTRLRLLATVKPDADWTIGGRLEAELLANSSKNFTRSKTKGAKNLATFNERYIEVTVEHRRYGKLYLGQGNTASNKTSQADLSGTNLAGRSEVYKWGAALEFWDSTNGRYSGISVHDAVDDMDGRSRKDRIRYDTPSFNGLKLATSVHEGGAWDLAAFYGQKIATVAIKAAASFVDMSPVSDRVKSQYSGSLALRHNNGWNAAIGIGGQDTKGEAAAQDPWFVYLKLGYRTKTLNRLGLTAFSLDHGYFDELEAKDQDATVWGLQLVQSIDAWRTDIFAGWRRYSLDSPGIDTAAIDIIGIGARFKF